MDYSIIKELLKEKNMTFQELSDRMGTDRNNLYNSLTKGNPTLQRLEKVSEILGVPTWRLFTEDTTQSNIFGIIVYKGQTYRIDSIAAYRALSEKIEEITEKRD